MRPSALQAIAGGFAGTLAKTLGDFLGIGWTAVPGDPVIKGMTWGVILWALAQTIVMPLVGGGFFNANAGGAMAVIGSLLGHLIYGGTLGAIAGGRQVVGAAAA